jgi:hypothetical protein
MPGRMQPARRSDQVVLWARTLALLVTNVIKLGGAFIAVRAVVEEPQPRALTLAFAAFMMSGAQLSEGSIVRAFERLMGLGKRPPE